MLSEKISIVIACFNDAEFIGKAVQSAFDQTYGNREIIVVDDGSDSRTKAVLKKLESKIDLLITQKNMGVSTARNNGVKKARGAYILNLDSDDYFDPAFCEKAVKVFQNNTNVKLVSCYANWFGAEQNSIEFRPEGGNIKDILIKNIAMGSSMFKKIDWEISGGYDERMHKGYEDWEFYIRLLEKEGIAVVIPEILFHYRNKQNSRNKQANLVKYDILEYIYLKHANLYKDHFPVFIQEWLKSNRNSEAFKQQVMDSLDYKIGHNLLKPFRLMGFFKRKSTK